MNLKQILAGLEKIKAKGEIDREVTTIENDSRNVVEGSMFFAIKGFTLDGTQFIPSAIEKGAKVIVVDETTDFKSLNIPEDVTLIVVPEIRESMAICACNFYDNPSRKFKLVGITGTKGKTTTTYMIKEILEKQGIKTGLVGTIATYIGNEMLMEDYFNSKLKLFKMCKTGFVNADDIQGSRIPRLVPDCDIKTYGIDNTCDLLAKDITITNSYVDFKVKIDNRNERVKVGIPGRFSVYNSLAAISVTTKLGCSAEAIKEALLEVRVPGRSELVNNDKELTIMIDFAHTPDSLKNILSAAKAYTRGRVISVFGCGGNRDSAKRPAMGEISGKIADYTIITSDNPRDEDPQEIVNQIEEGIKKTKGKYTCIVDRVEAIRHAIEMANKKDIIILAGKGHEPYQEIKGVKHPFDEREIVNKIIKGEI